MGAAWRRPEDRDLDKVCEMITRVRDLGASKQFYGEIITTRAYGDRLETLGHARNAGPKVCAGGIVGRSESRNGRATMLATMANLPKRPENVPINRPGPIEGTPLANRSELDPLEFARTNAVAKFMMPASVIRLSAERDEMGDELQALCFLAGTASIFVGTELLTTPNPGGNRDAALLSRIGFTGNHQSSYDLADAAE